MLQALMVLALAAEPTPAPFVVTVVDDQSGRGVPLVELRTVHAVSYFTDSNGVAVIREPALSGEKVFFSVSSHGYEFPADGFGTHGTALRVTPGGSAKLSIKRLNVAERLYRVTGADIYRDSVLAGLPAPIKQPLLNARVLGSDSVMNAVYRGKLYWFWGDTNRPSYPLGNFHVPAATSELPSRGGLDPDLGVNLVYFAGEKGFAKETARMPGEGPTWLTSLAVLPDATGRERMFAGYVKVTPPLSANARGLAGWDDDKQQFAHIALVDMAAPAFASGDTFRHTDANVDYLYFVHPFPLTRVRATADDFIHVARYECFTPMLPGARMHEPRLDRDRDGRLVYSWRRNALAIGPAEEEKLIASHLMKPEEARWRLRDRETGKSVIPHAASVCWNDYRRRWVMITTEVGGTSYLGEVWYAEAESPTGPWGAAVKVVGHEKYSFYNPKQHPEFAKDRGRVIYFEGTYSHTFSGNRVATPRYDYNQIMYKLDLSDPRLTRERP